MAVIDVSDRFWDEENGGWRLGYEEAWARDLEAGDTVYYNSDLTGLEAELVDVGKGLIIKKARVLPAPIR